MIDFVRIGQAALGSADTLLSGLFPQGRLEGREFCVGNLRGAPGDSLKVNLDTGTWTDFASREKGGGDLISLWARARGLKNGQAAKEIAEQLGIGLENSTGKRPETRYEIRDETGRLVAVHVRTDLLNSTTQARSKRIRWETPDGSAGLGGSKVVDLPLYMAHRLPDWHSKGVDAVVVTEGEKAAQSLERRGVAVLGTVTGAAVIPADKSLRPLLRFKCVRLWADSDPQGIEHMRRIAFALLRLGHHNVRIVQWPEAPAKGDAADFSGSQTELEALLDAAAKFESDQTG